VRVEAVRPAFPPSVVVAIKALACELPQEHGLPLSRLSVPEIRREALQRGLVASIGETTVWRWLAEDAIRPWHHRSWLFPRDPDFEEKAAPILDLYAGLWRGRRLSTQDCILSADEKTSIQARRRLHPTRPPIAGQLMRVEHEYERQGAWAYLAAWDVRRAKIHGRCEPKTGIAPFERLVDQVMRQEPYRSAPRVFWVVDNGSSHRGPPCATRMAKRWPTLTLVHTPVPLTPNDVQSLAELEDRLLGFQEHYEQVAKPFEWKFTRRDLRRLLSKLDDGEPEYRLAA
jgi:hypothetical protein